MSFAVERGEIFGLLGPNGAGKTTTIRLMLDICRLDRGTVSILGGPMTEEKKERIGYMPEVRGLSGLLWLVRRSLPGLALVTNAQEVFLIPATCT